jgi:hypothetical protein
VRVGDIVTVGDTDGVVTKIQIRATTIRNWDRKELLVPNKEFVTGRLLNWSLSDQMTRVVVVVGVAYGSDVDKALALMREAAEEHEHVLDDPAPVLSFEGFGDNSLTLILRAYLSSIDYRIATITDLHEVAGEARVLRALVAVHEGGDVPGLLVGERQVVAERHVGLDVGGGGVDAVHAGAPVVGLLAPERREDHLRAGVAALAILAVADGAVLGVDDGAALGVEALAGLVELRIAAARGCPCRRPVRRWRASACSSAGRGWCGFPLTGRCRPPMPGRSWST